MLLSNLLTTLFGYITWHYTTAFKDIFDISRTYIWGVVNFFSIRLLLETLFTPFKRLKEPKVEGFDPAESATRLVVNILMRIVGASMRIALLVVGLVVLLVVTVGSLVYVVVWTILPAAVPVGVVYGILMILGYA